MFAAAAPKLRFTGRDTLLPSAIRAALALLLYTLAEDDDENDDADAAPCACEGFIALIPWGTDTLLPQFVQNFAPFFT